MLDSRHYLQMSTGKMRPVIPVPKRANGFSIDSIMGKDDGDRAGTSSDESEQGDEPRRPTSSHEDIQRLMGFGSRLPPLHPALPTHVQQLLLSEPTARANNELLAARSQAWAIGNQHLGAFSTIGAVAGSGLGITHNPYQGLHHPGAASVHTGLLPSTRDPLSLYPWMIARQGPSLMGLPYGPSDGGFFFHPYRKPKRIRTAFSPAQLLKLEQAFEKNHYVVGQERKELASKLSLTETQVKVWFQNRRTKHKRVKSDDEEGDNENISVEDDEDIISPRSHSEADEHETFQDGRR